MTALVALLVIAPSTLVAAPKGKPAKAAFDRGVAAYTRRDWPAAADALAKSYELEPDVETLFAWAQAERQQDHCDKAIELYDKLLDQKLPEANRKVIVTKSDECKAIIAATKPPPAPEPPPTPAPAKPKLDPVEEPVIVAKPAPAH
ncbi:MAG: hypothetical protein ABI867_15810, partial [Kofleriaceae bacterium]